MNQRMRFMLTGIVQGVGFRPFIFNLAEGNGLTGWVLNNSSGVILEVEGSPKALQSFEESLIPMAPLLAKIESVKKEIVPVQGSNFFEIKASTEEAGEKFTLISPDLATCPDCRRELFSRNDRRHGYPFTNCTNCGPRLTIIRDVPYDRAYTTMAAFEMCPDCSNEYDDPRDRRFHAQPNACAKCGPALQLLDNKGEIIVCSDPLTEAVKFLSEGKILAIKGIGGYHLACDATNEGAVDTLRSRKVREDKPFAVMMAGPEQAGDYCHFGQAEIELLEGSRSPIVLLALKEGGLRLAPGIAPGNTYLGVMVPYTPLHHLLMADLGRPLVMTSGNISSEPIAYQDDEALERLEGIADYFLIHNREIFRRCDDSVTRFFRDQEYILRRSRGYAPEPVKLPFRLDYQVLACGAEQKNTFCLTKDNYAFLSHHIGDLENLETLASFEEGIEHFQRLFYLKPEVIAYDLHPEYLSTKYAMEREDLVKIGVQHHHAHIVACMAENGLTEEVIGVALDGTGYGTDGKLWGGEFFTADYQNFRRLAHLAYLPMPGAAMAVKEPWRMACAYLKEAFGPEFLKLDLEFTASVPKQAWQLLDQALEKGLNAPLTSSMGRLFDAVAAILGIRNKVNYEGQGAIELEQLAVLGNEIDTSFYPWEVKAGSAEVEYEGCSQEEKIIDVLPLIRGIVENLQGGLAKADIARKFHLTIARIIADMSMEINRSTGIDKVCLSGGVFQNILLLELTMNILEKEGLKPYIHSKVPANDGGIALGQGLIANERRKAQCV